MLTSIQKMLKALEENNIVYCHWKSNEHILDALEGDTDLDMLFLPEQRAAIDRTLNANGLKRFRAMPLMQYNAIEDYIGFDKDTAKIWHLHTHYRMTLGEKHLKGYTINPWTDYILENREWCSCGIYQSSAEAELVLLIVRLALKNRLRDIGGSIGKEDLAEYNWLIQRIDTDKLQNTAAEMTDMRTGDLILALTDGNLRKKNQLIPLQKQLRRLFKPYTGYSGLQSWAVRTRRELFWLWGGFKRRIGFNSTQPGRRISPSGGAVAAILGCDGAGKSTTLHYVKKEFQKKIDIMPIYFGSGDGSSSLIRRPMRFIARRIGGKGVGRSIENEYKSHDKNGTRVSPKARAYSAAKVIWAITLANEKKRKLRKMTKARNAGMLVLTDRYPQTEISGYGDGPLLAKYMETSGLMKKIAKWEYSIYRFAYRNPPDLVIKLIVPTEVAIARKPEMTEEEIENKKQAVMAMNPSKRAVVVDTSRSTSVTFGEVMEAIWEIL